MSLCPQPEGKRSLEDQFPSHLSPPQKNIQQGVAPFGAQAGSSFRIFIPVPSAYSPKSLWASRWFWAARCYLQVPELGAHHRSSRSTIVNKGAITKRASNILECEGWDFPCPPPTAPSLSCAHKLLLDAHGRVSLSPQRGAALTWFLREGLPHFPVLRGS